MEPFTNEEILDILIEAKTEYVSAYEEKCLFYGGMCTYIESAFYDLFEEKSEYYGIWIVNLSKVIPEFNRDYLKGTKLGSYWWPLLDTKSRIEAFNTLISLYEDKIK